MSCRHDKFGRVLQSRQTVGTAYPVLEYTYNKQGGLKTMKYPSGRMVSYGFDVAGRVTQVDGTVAGISTGSYASGMHYARMEDWRGR